MKRSKKIFGLTFFAFLALFISYFDASAQNKLYSTDKGKIKFFSSAPLEDIEAVNSGVSSVLNAETGAVLFKLLIKNFKFQNNLMQEHFNENYMESEKYPNSEFKGTISDIKAIDFFKPGKKQVNITGDLTIHGVKRTVTHGGTLEVLPDGGVKLWGKFPISVADYKVEIPTMVLKNIAETVEVTTDILYAPVKK